MTPKILADIMKGADVKPCDRLVWTLDELSFLVSMVRLFGSKICLTSGSFDLAHIGHACYTRRGWQKVRLDGQAGLMLVAIEEDEKITRRKGPNRPVIPLNERAEFLASTRWVDVLVVKRGDYPKWEITRIVKPDVLLAVEGTYNPRDIEELSQICGEVFVVPRQAENSTSAQFRRIQLGGADELMKVSLSLIDSKAELALGSGDVEVMKSEAFRELVSRICSEAIEEAYQTIAQKALVSSKEEEVPHDHD